MSKPTQVSELGRIADALERIANHLVPPAQENAQAAASNDVVAPAATPRRGKATAPATSVANVVPLNAEQHAHAPTDLAGMQAVANKIVQSLGPHAVLVASLLQEFGASKLSELALEHYPAFYAKMMDLPDQVEAE